MEKNIKNTTGLFLVILFACFSFLPVLAQEKQNDLKESYIGRWYGKVKTQNISRAGGWSSEKGFLGYHETSKDIWWLNFDVKFLHPLDAPSAIKEFKKRGYPAEYIKALKNLKPADELTIIGHVILSGYDKYTHETREYCEECSRTDGTKKTNFPRARIDVSGRVDLIENKINFHFENVPKKYQISSGLDHENIKLVSPDIIDVNYKYIHKDHEGATKPSTDQKVTGKLYRIQTIKYTLGKTIFVDEPIKTDKFTQKDIEIPEVGEVKVKPESECEFKSKNEIEHFKGEIRNKVKNLGNDDIAEEEKKDVKVKPGSETKVENKNDISEQDVRNKVENLPNGYFGIATPVAIAGVRGTDFITIVEKNSTTLKVFEGEVAFSDINNEKTVIVKKNQMSTVKAGGVPSEPKEMDKVSKWFSLH